MNDKLKDRNIKVLELIDRLKLQNNSQEVLNYFDRIEFYIKTDPRRVRVTGLKTRKVTFTCPNAYPIKMIVGE